MGQEIELKLSLPETEQRRFLRSALLRDAQERSTGRLLNIYYDTPDLALQCNGIALRLRKSGRRWLQTVKCAGTSTAGLSSRPEWEEPYTGQFNFDAVDDEATRKKLERLKSRLVPIFETSFLRTTWRIRKTHTSEAALIVALDRGTVSTKGKSVPLSEIEIELAGDSIDQIFVFADRLAQEFSLTPGLWSKAERGYRLFVGTAESPCRARPVALDANMTTNMAFRQIANACLDHLHQNHQGGIQSTDAEYIHQMRVATRRLLAALRLFKPMLPETLNEQLVPPLRALMSALGNARDLDVLTAEIVDPVVNTMSAEPRIAALKTVVAERCSTARLTAVQTLSAPDYGRLLLLTMTKLHQLTDDTEENVPSLNSFANARLKRLRHKVLLLARQARNDDPTSLHQLRIGAKRLRYALEFFAPLLSTRQTVTLIKQLTRLQNTLGQLNDLANAGALLMDCAGDEASLREAVSLIGGWHGQRHADLLAKVPRVLTKLHKLRIPKAG